MHCCVTVFIFIIIYQGYLAKLVLADVVLHLLWGLIDPPLPVVIVDRYHSFALVVFINVLSQHNMFVI